MAHSTPVGMTLINNITGHGDAIVRLRWMPGGQTLASAAIDNSIRVWDINSEAEIHRITGQARGFTEFALSPHGRYAVTASWSDDDLEVWHFEQAMMAHKLAGHNAAVNAVTITPDGRFVVSAADDGSIRVWHLDSGDLHLPLNGHSDFAWAVTITADSRYIISGGARASIKVWDIRDGRELGSLEGHSGWVMALVMHPDGRTLASSSDDCTIRIWDIESGETTHILSGHTAAINCIDFSSDGRFLASKSMDDTVRLWRTDTWESIAVLDEPVSRGRGYYPNGLAFHPSQPMLATLGERDSHIRVWRLDKSVLLAGTSEHNAYTTARIVMVGGRSVGKSGLGYRLTHDAASEQTVNSYATKHYQTWVARELSMRREDGTLCEVILWDYGGNLDHPLSPTIMPGEIDLALLLFDPTNWQDPLSSIEYWLKQLRYDNFPIVLVGARIDSGAVVLSDQELEDFCVHHRLAGGYVGTSALTGQGIDKLLAVIRDLLHWERIPAAVDQMQFQQTRAMVQQLKAAGDHNVLLSVEDLNAQLAERDSNWEVSTNDLRLILRHLENHGHVILIDEGYVLLEPARLIDLTGAIMLESRRYRRGLATLDADRLRRGDYKFADLDGLSGLARNLLMKACLALLKRHHVYFDEQFEHQNLLIFPAMMNQKRPLVAITDVEDDASYRVTGAVREVFASLVVLLNLTGLYTRTYQWGNQAQFEMGIGEICGFRVENQGAQQCDLVLYYGKTTPEYTRSIFHGLFEKYLHTQPLTVTRYPPVICSECGHRQSRQDVVRLMDLGKGQIYCVVCGTSLPLQYAGKSLPNTGELRLRAEAEAMPGSRSRMQTHFPDVYGKIKEFFVRDNTESASCFISYAWGVAQHEAWVRRLADYLGDAGIDALLDQWDNPDIGQSNEQFLKQIADSEFILVVGTPLYRQKFDGKLSTTGSFVSDEVDIINKRLNGTEQERASVLPLLLEGDERNSFPEALQGRVYSDFQQERFFFVSLFNLILTLYRIPSKDPIIGDLRAFIRDNSSHKGSSPHG
jgi:WD40 repeat protein